MTDTHRIRNTYHVFASHFRQLNTKLSARFSPRKLNLSPNQSHLVLFIFSLVVVWEMSIGTQLTSTTIVQLATSTLGGLISFIALMFAIGAITYESGAYRGTRALQILVKESNWYVKQLSAGIILSLVTAMWPENLLFAIMVSQLIRVLISTPRLLNSLVSRSSAKSMATELRAELLETHDTPSNREDVRLILNDLRTSAIHLWRSGDVEGTRLLIDTFLDSIPEHEKRGRNLDDSDQFKFLAQWIRMLDHDLGSLVLLADIMKDRAIEEAHKGNYRLVAQYAEQMTRILRRCISEKDSGELTERTCLLLSETCRTAISLKIGRKQSLDVALVEIANLTRTQTENLLRAKRANGPTSSSLVVLMFDLYVTAVTATYAPASMHADTRIGAFPDLFVELLTESIVPLDETLGTIATSFFESSNAIESVNDVRVALFGPFLSSLALLAEHNSEYARSLYMSSIRRVVMSKYDWGTARYLNMCLRHVREQSIHPILSVKIRADLLNLAVLRSKTRDVEQEFDLLLSWCLSTRSDPGTEKDAVIVAVKYLAESSDLSFFVDDESDDALESTLWRIYGNRESRQVLENLIPVLLEGLESSFTNRLEEGFMGLNRRLLLSLFTIRMTLIGKQTKGKVQSREAGFASLQQNLESDREYLGLERIHLKAVDQTLNLLRRQNKVKDELILRGWIGSFFQILRERNIKRDSHLDVLESKYLRDKIDFNMSLDRRRMNDALTREVETSVDRFVSAHDTSDQIPTSLDTSGSNEVARIQNDANEIETVINIVHSICSLAAFGSRRYGEKSTQDLAVFVAKIDRLSDAVKFDGSRFIFAAAKRSIWIMNRSNERTTQLQAFSAVLASGRTEFDRLSPTERIGLIRGHSIAAEYEFRSGDPLDATRLLLSVLAAQVSSDFSGTNLVSSSERIPSSGELSRAFIQTLREAITILNSPDLVSVLDSNATRSKISDCEKYLRVIFMTVLNFGWNSPDLVDERSLRKLFELYSALPSSLGRVFGVENHLLNKEAAERRSEIRRLMTKYSENPWPSHASPSLTVLAMACAARFINEGGERCRPQFMILLLDRRNEADKHAEFKWIRDEVKSMSENDAVQLSRIFDWISERLDSSEPAERRLSALANRMIVRHRHNVSSGLIPAWSDFLVELSNLVSQGAAPQWALDLLFPSKSSGWSKGFLAQLLIPSTEPDGKTGLLSPSNRAGLIEQFEPSIERVVRGMLSSPSGSKKSSEVGRMLMDLRLSIPETSSKELELVDKLIRHWNPYFRPHSVDEVEPWLPAIRLSAYGLPE